MAKKKTEKERRAESDREYNKLVVKAMAKTFRKRYAPSLWSRFIGSLENVLNALFIFIVAMTSIFIMVTIIENPISLAILCGTILLIVMWGKR